MNDVSYLLLDRIEINQMQISTLTKTISSIENMVHSEGKHQQLLIPLHRLSSEVTSFSNHYQSVINHHKQSQKEVKQLRKKLRKTTAKLQKKDEEYEQLKSELSSTRDIYEHKLQKLLRKSEQRTYQDAPSQQLRRQRRSSRSKKGREVQCQIIEGSIVKELQERNLCLLKKINHLEKELEEQKNESNSKQLYIQSLITALEGDVQKELQDHNEGTETVSSQSRSNCSDINDNSTIADSLKDYQDRQSFVEHEKGETNDTFANKTPSSIYWLRPFQQIFGSAKRLFWNG